jgi:hypothetical protein
MKQSAERLSPSRGEIFLYSTSFRPVLGPPSLLSRGYWGLFLWGVSRWGVKLTTHLQLMSGQEYVDLYIHSPMRLHGIVLN